MVITYSSDLNYMNLVFFHIVTIMGILIVYFTDLHSQMMYLNMDGFKKGKFFWKEYQCLQSFQACMGKSCYKCGTLHAIFTCSSSGLWWIPLLIESFYVCIAKIILVMAEAFECYIHIHINCTLTIF